jgi:hypothetical protein
VIECFDSIKRSRVLGSLKIDKQVVGRWPSDDKPVLHLGRVLARERSAESNGPPSTVSSCLAGLCFLEEYLLICIGANDGLAKH